MEGFHLRYYLIDSLRSIILKNTPLLQFLLRLYEGEKKKKRLRRQINSNAYHRQPKAPTTQESNKWTLEVEGPIGTSIVLQFTEFLQGAGALFTSGRRALHAGTLLGKQNLSHQLFAFLFQLYVLPIPVGNTFST